MRVDGKTLTIAIDLSAPGKVSSTGKTHLIATTGGAVQLVGCDARDGIKVAVNVMAPLDSAYKTSGVTVRAKRGKSTKMPEAVIEDTLDQ